MKGEWKPLLAACLIALCVGGGFGAIALRNGPQQEIASARDNASEKWVLSDKIALVASVGGILQVIALVVTIGVMVRNGRRQLRAYIFVENTWAKLKPDGNEWTVEYKLKNTGLTPAKRTTVIETARAVSWPIKTLPEPVNRDYFGTMAPNGDSIDCWSEDKVIVDPNDLSSEAKAIVLIGKVTYCDAFGQAQATEFCFYLTGNFPADGEMSIYERANEST